MVNDRKTRLLDLDMTDKKLGIDGRFHVSYREHPNPESTKRSGDWVSNG